MIEVRRARKAAGVVPAFKRVDTCAAASVELQTSKSSLELILLLAGSTMIEVRRARKAAGVIPAFKRVDTCAAEFEAATPYMYSSYDGNDECESTTERKVRHSGHTPTCMYSHTHHYSHADSTIAEHSMAEPAMPYMYSSYDGNDECKSTTEREVRRCL